MTDYKKDVPEDRTVVPGTWSDILDDWADSFGGDTSQNSSLENIAEVVLAFKQLHIEQKNISLAILNQLELLNVRIEQAFETGITKEDI